MEGEAPGGPAGGGVSREHTEQVEARRSLVDEDLVCEVTTC